MAAAGCRFGASGRFLLRRSGRAAKSGNSPPDPSEKGVVRSLTWGFATVVGVLFAMVFAMVFAIVFAGVGVARPGISRVYLMKSSCLCLFVGGGEWSRLCYGYGSIRFKAHTNAAYKNSIRFKHTV